MVGSVMDKALHKLKRPLAVVGNLLIPDLFGVSSAFPLRYLKATHLNNAIPMPAKQQVSLTPLSLRPIIPSQGCNFASLILIANTHVSKKPAVQAEHLHSPSCRNCNVPRAIANTRMFDFGSPLNDLPHEFAAIKIPREYPTA